MLNVDPAMPDQPYPFDENVKYPRESHVGTEYTWLAGPLLADWFASGVIHNYDSVQVMDMYIRDGKFQPGPLSETMADIRARFDQEHPYDEDE